MKNNSIESSKINLLIVAYEFSVVPPNMSVELLINHMMGGSTT